MAAKARQTSTRAFATPSTLERLKQEIEALESLDLDLLRKRWRSLMGWPAPAHLSKGLTIRILAYRHQVNELGELDRSSLSALQKASGEAGEVSRVEGIGPQPGASAITLKSGTLLTREYAGVMHRVMVMEAGYSWNGRPFRSLSEVALAITGTKWNGPRFFGLRPGAGKGRMPPDGEDRSSVSVDADDARIPDKARRGGGDRASTPASMGDPP
jgi:hypothetical protein